MADWYLSSAVYATITAFQASHAYSVGDFVKPTAPGINTSWTFRCTTAGTSSTEPSWVTTNNGTSTSGGAVFTNVTGQSAYGWSASAGTLATISNQSRALVGDRVFISSDHSESTATSVFQFNNLTHAFGLVQLISVNRAGSVPPVVSDIQSGAVIATTGALQLDAYCPLFWQGITLSSASNLSFNSTATKSHYLKNCALVLNNATSTSKISSNTIGKVTWDNTTVQFGHVNQGIGASIGPFDITWINTPNAIQGATIPLVLFNTTAQMQFLATCRGVDLSAITGTILTSANGPVASKVLLDSCKIASSVTRFSLASVTASNAFDEIELVNCFDGTNVINERHTPAGDVNTDRATYLTSGAQDDIGNFSVKLSSSSRSDFATMPLDGFQLDVENTVTGSSKTATVEVVSSLTLNNNDIRLVLEYMGTSGNPIASFGDSLSSVLASASALPSSSSTWTVTGNTGPGSTIFSPTDLLGVVVSAGVVVTNVSGSNGSVRSVNSYTSGKYYWECTYTNIGTNTCSVGIASATFNLNFSTGLQCAYANRLGSISINNVVQSGSLGTLNAGNIVGIAVDFTAQLIWFRVAPSGNWNGSGTANPATGTGGYSISALTGALYAATMLGSNTNEIITANFGINPFTGAVPSGFTAGLPATATKQALSVTFTPQRAGRVRGFVRLGKPGTTCWVNPQIAIT